MSKNNKNLEIFNIQFKDQTLFSATLNLKAHNFNPKMTEKTEKYVKNLKKAKRKNKELKRKVKTATNQLTMESKKRLDSTRMRMNSALSAI
jgi:hypothetical protein